MFDDSTWIFATIFINATGVAALAATRLSERWGSSLTLQVVFLLSLLLIGVNAMCLFQASNTLWLWGAALMLALPTGATADFGRSPRRGAQL